LGTISSQPLGIPFKLRAANSLEKESNKLGTRVQIP
jgi:hypothetical protein